MQVLTRKGLINVLRQYLAVLYWVDKKVDYICDRYEVELFARILATANTGILYRRLIELIQCFI